MKKILIPLIFPFFSSITFAQKITYDTLWQISPKVSIYAPIDMASKSRYTIDSDTKREFHFNYLSLRRKKVNHFSYAYYSHNIKKNISQAFQEKLKNGTPVEKADSFILWKLKWYIDNYNEDNIFRAWDFYEKIVPLKKLQNKYHYIDYTLCLQHRKQIDRNKHWDIEKYDTIFVWHCKMERYLLVDSVLYSFSTSTLKHYKNRKKTLRIAKRNFKKFVRCIWVKDEEEE